MRVDYEKEAYCRQCGAPIPLEKVVPRSDGRPKCSYCNQLVRVKARNANRIDLREKARQNKRYH